MIAVKANTSSGIVWDKYLGLNEGPILFLSFGVLQAIGLGILGDC